MKQMIIPKLHNLEQILAIEIFYTVEFGNHVERFASKTAYLGEALRQYNSYVIAPFGKNSKTILLRHKNENNKTSGIYFYSKLAECMSRNSLLQGKCRCF